MKLIVEIEREAEDRWIADVVTLPGVMCYGPTPEAAIAKVKGMALERLADMAAHDGLVIDNSITFELAQEAA